LPRAGSTSDCSPPNLHDGSLATLEEVVEFYDRGGRANAHLDPEIRPRGFTADESTALVAFLRLLSGQVREGSKQPSSG
jgi:cytochrome c peroxidase